MGNQQQKPQRRKKGVDQDSNSKSRVNKVPHANTHSLKNPPTIYEAYSITGPTLKVVQLDGNDLNNYIHTKNPKANVDPRFTREEDYSYEEDRDAFILKSRAKIWENEPNKLPRPKLKLDDIGGIGQIQKVMAFDYQKYLRHFIQRPKRPEKQQKQADKQFEGQPEKEQSISMQKDQQ